MTSLERKEIGRGLEQIYISFHLAKGCGDEGVGVSGRLVVKRVDRVSKRQQFPAP